MKILMLVPLIPNTSRSGGQTRWYNLIKYMSSEHEITLFTFIKNKSEKKFIKDLRKYCKEVRVFRRPSKPWTFRNIFLAVVSYYPFLVIRNWSPRVKRAMREELQKNNYDIIHAEAFYVMPHIPRSDVPTILVEQTIEYQVYKHYVLNEVPWLLRLFFMVDIWKLRFWELYFWKKTDQLVAVSDEDKKFMQKLLPEVDVDVIPNGVDAEYYAKKQVERKKPMRVMYGVTNFEWLQNIEAVEILIKEVWPEIVNKVSNVKLWIVGRMVPKWIIKLAEKRDDIKVTESIKVARDAYLGATVMVTPIRGSGGTRLKILEAMAAGLAVVSTSVGVAGLNVSDGKQVLISDSSSGLAQKTIRLLEDEKLLKRIGDEGRRFIEKNYDWKVIVKLHDRVYEKAKLVASR